MKKWIIRLSVVIVVAGMSILSLFIYRSMTAPEEVHFHAGFVVFNQGEKQDFSDYKYMHIKPCGEEEHEELSEEEEQNEKAHLHDNVGDVVHVHRDNATWKDLFTNMHVPIDYSKITAFVNGEKISNFANKPIKAYDSAVIFIGDVKTDLLKEAVTKKYIEQIEQKSENCGE